MKNFYIDHDNTAIIRDWNRDYIDKITGVWNKEIPKYVKNFGSSPKLVES